MSKRHNPFGPVSTAMVTPFTPDLEVDYTQLTALAEHLVSQGSTCLVAVGTTGEAPTLTRDEKLKIFQTLNDHFEGKVPIIAGTGSYSTEETLSLSKAAKEAGAHGLLVVNPYYNKPSQAGLVAHFSAVADAVDLPLILYNHPGRTGVAQSLDTTVTLSKHPNIVAIKDSSGDLEYISQLRQYCPDDFLILSGDDPLTLPMLALGADGVVSVASHVAGRAIAEMIRRFQQGQTAEALDLHHTLFALMKVLFCAPSPSPTKAALAQLGLPVGGVRMPLTALSPSEAKSVSEVVASTLTALESHPCMN